MKASPLSPETSDAILDAAWALIVKGGVTGASLSAIAKEAGVTRQSIYLAFGNRAGLLTAMARRADGQSPYSRQMAEIASGRGEAPGTLLAFVEAWLMHLPEIYPVGSLLGAAAVTDPDAAQVFNDRMVGSLHARFLDLCTRLGAKGHLARGLTPAAAADLTWSFTHLDAWRHLVVERGWSADTFRENRLDLIRRTVLR